ncbi:hypothetical protein FN846DRAFT_1009265 [Sphaerosporella brunnea]|uniref:Uncharacterized protein n=1 Tax=Sphaerosporella brunnea TaxID=1250544 RepID=A0A5J5F215_9PEZI|nr:hypothetical protein FN846DRAFT_1009265 [Sphaerosporella brunnea]
MGLYQKYNDEKKESVYIVLCASEAAKENLSKAFQSESTVSRPMLMISVFLNSSERSWRALINYLESQLLDIEGKALCQEVFLTFKDCQNLLRLRNRVSEVHYSLKGALSVAGGYKAHCEDLVRLGVEGVDESTFLQIELFSATIKGHIDSTERLLAQIEGMSKIIYQALTYGMASDTKEESKAAQKDARSMKTLTFIAMLYLPASLVASIFSSNLIQSVQVEGSKTRFVLTTQFWTYPVVTFSLMALTLVSVSVWHWRLERKRGPLHEPLANA